MGKNIEAQRGQVTLEMGLVGPGVGAPPNSPAQSSLLQSPEGWDIHHMLNLDLDSRYTDGRGVLSLFSSSPYH